MNTVTTLGGTAGFANGWWEEFKVSVGPLGAMFDALDADASGKIGKEELKVALITSDEFKSVLELMSMDDSEALFMAIDLDDSLEISYSEFCGYFAGAPFVHFFVDADKDGHSFLTHEEFATAVKEHPELDMSSFGMTADQIFDEGDLDHNDQLSFSEFAAVFLRLGVKEEL